MPVTPPNAGLRLAGLWAGLAEGDPQAGALQMLRGMLRQGQAMMPPTGNTTPSPAMLEQAEALRRMLQPGRP